MAYEALKSWMDRYLASGRTVGCAAVVYRNGKKDFRYACGYSDFENRIPITGDEFYNLYSCSKVATVTAGMQLLERGYFLLSDPLYEYMPEFRDMYVKTDDGIRKARNPITIRDLFTMSAGFNYDMGFFKEAAGNTDGSTREVLRALSTKPLDFEPGTAFQYSLCHDVLAALVSVISGMPFRSYMKENIFDPLGMDDTCYYVNDDLWARMAQQYRRVDDADGSLHFENVGKANSYIPYDEYDSGGAGVISTLDDYVKLLAALAGGGKGLNGNRILSPNAVELMRTPAIRQELLPTENWDQYKGYSYGLGVRVLTDRIKASTMSNIGEFGWCGAAGSACLMDPAEDLAMFFTQHILEPHEEYYFPRLRNALYS